MFGKKYKHEEKSQYERSDYVNVSKKTCSLETDNLIENVTSSSTKDPKREEWMGMTGMLKTYTKHDITPKRETKEKRHIDSYNPSTSSRELNPYWRDGGTGLPQTSEEFRKSRVFLKPSDDDNFYSRSPNSDLRKHTGDSQHNKEQEAYYKKSYGWRKHRKSDDRKDDPIVEPTAVEKDIKTNPDKDNLYLSDEKMNKLAAKIVKAEIMGDSALVNKLKEKLEKAREYRKQNPNAGTEDNERVMLMSTNSVGNSKPLSKLEGDRDTKGCKRKAETHISGQRMKYFGNDDKYNLAQMFQNEKYSDNYEEEAEFAKILSKHKNPNDDLEDIFMDKISKNTNERKESEREKQRAISQHSKMERSLEGCEYCVDSKNMLKHLMVSCQNKVYLALPARKSIVKGHCIISTVQHNTCVTALDEDVWEEIENYKKALTNFFNTQNKDVVFYETAIRLHKFPHMILNCVPMPRDVGDMAPIYFKKALLECETEWSMNKKIIELKGKNIRKCIPKGLPYFWVDFGMDPGFAHVIEDQQLFPKSFAEEIIAGILDIDHTMWKNPQKEHGDAQRKKVLEFLKEWKRFDGQV